MKNLASAAVHAMPIHIMHATSAMRTCAYAALPCPCYLTLGSVAPFLFWMDLCVVPHQPGLPDCPGVGGKCKTATSPSCRLLWIH